MTSQWRFQCRNKSSGDDVPLSRPHLSFLFFWQRAKLLKQKKEEGNEAFRRARFQDAYDLYSEALKIDPLNVFTNSKLYNNRATVLSKVSTSKLYYNRGTVLSKVSTSKLSNNRDTVLPKMSTSKLYNNRATVLSKVSTSKLYNNRATVLSKVSTSKLYNNRATVLSEMGKCR